MFVELAALCVQLFLELLLFLLRLMGIAAGRLGDKPGKGEPRFTTARLLAAAAPMALILLIMGLAYGFYSWRRSVQIARKQATIKQIEQQADRFSQRLQDDGRFDRKIADGLKENDAWGNPLLVEFDETLLHEVVRVRSQGADGKPHTDDDLTATRRVLRAKKAIAKDAFERAKDAVKKRFSDQ